MIALSRLRTRLDLLIRRLLVQSRIYKDPFEYDELRFVTNAFPIQSLREREREKERVISHESKTNENTYLSLLTKRSNRLWNSCSPTTICTMKLDVIYNVICTMDSGNKSDEIFDQIKYKNKPPYLYTRDTKLGARDIIFVRQPSKIVKLSRPTVSPG